MAEVDLEKVRELAESAQTRAEICHVSYEAYKMFDETDKAAQALGDFFYWIGHTNAYKGIIAMAELATIVEDEMDAEGSCP